MGYLVMLDRLRSGQEARIQRGRALKLLHYLLAFLDNSHNGITGLAAGRLVQFLEDFFEASNMLLSLGFMLFKGRLEFGRLRCLCHLRKGAKDFFRQNRCLCGANGPIARRSPPLLSGGALPNLSGTNACTLPAMVDPTPIGALDDAIAIARDRYCNLEALWQVLSCDHCINLARQSLDNSST